MNGTDITARLLQDIREELKGSRQEQREFREEQRNAWAGATARFELIETTLRDLAEQLVMLGRGIRVALDQKPKADDRIDDHERRLSEIEKRLPR